MATLTTARGIGATLVQERRDRLEEYGDQLLFYVKALAWTPRAIRRYRREIYNTLAEVAFGAGGLTLIAGTVGVIAFLAFFAGTEVGIQGYASLSQIGVAKFTAFISAYFNTREVAPLVSSIALAATVGCGYTARLGAMRISEEIDALEVMAVPSLPFLVTTRIIAAFIAVIPLYIVALAASYLSPRLIVTLIYGQSPGTYDHYFIQFLPPVDMLWSFGKLLFLAIAGLNALFFETRWGHRVACFYELTPADRHG